MKVQAQKATYYVDWNDLKNFKEITYWEVKVVSSTFNLGSTKTEKQLSENVF